MSRSHEPSGGDRADATVTDAGVTDTDTGAPAPASEPPVDVPLTRTRGGRRLLNVVAIALLGAMLVSNLPDSELRDRARLVERPITDVTGLSQNWALFAPNPRSSFLRLRAEVEREDGTVEVWTPPVGDRLLGVFRTYRWRKWANGVVDPDATRLQRGAAAYLQEQFTEPGASPVAEVRLYRGVHVQPRPGSGEPADRDPDFEEELLYRAVSEASPDDEEDAQ